MERERIILSVKPVFARSILTGEKRYELRRLCLSVPEGTVVYLYATAPEKAVVGEFTLGVVHIGSPENLWVQFGEALGISRKTFDEYLEGTQHAYAIEIRYPISWARPVRLASVRDALGTFSPPQFYRRVSAQLGKLLAREKASSAI